MCSDPALIPHLSHGWAPGLLKPGDRGGAARNGAEFGPPGTVPTRLLHRPARPKPHDTETLSLRKQTRIAG